MNPLLDLPLSVRLQLARDEIAANGPSHFNIQYWGTGCYNAIETWKLDFNDCKTTGCIAGQIGSLCYRRYGKKFNLQEIGAFIGHVQGIGFRPKLYDYVSDDSPFSPGFHAWEPYQDEGVFDNAAHWQRVLDWFDDEIAKAKENDEEISEEIKEIALASS